MTSAGFSSWWPTPVRPGDHFSAEELARSAAVHSPVRRLRVAAGLAQVVLLMAAAWALGSSGPLRGSDWLASTDAVDGVGDPARWGRAMLGAAAVVLPWRLVGAVTTRVLARSPGVDAVPGPGSSWPGPARFAVGLVVPMVVLAIAAALLLGPLVDPTVGWIVVGGAAAGVAGASVLATHARVERARPIGGDIPTAWTGLVDRAGPGGRVGFAGLADEREVIGPAIPTGSHPGPGARPPGASSWVGANACAVGLGRDRRILVDPSLVDAPLADFVVAHELTHLRRRHPEIQLVLNVAVVAAALGVVPALALTGWPWSVVDRRPDDPLTIPLAVLLVVVAGWLARIPVAWVLRALERQADAGAVALVGVPDRAGLRGLHLGGGELAPPRLAGLMAAHPAPAERLEYLDRGRAARPYSSSTRAGSSTGVG